MWPSQQRGGSDDHRLGVFAVAIAIAFIASSVTLVANPATIGRARAADPVATTTTLDAIPAVVSGSFTATGHVSPSPLPIESVDPVLGFKVDDVLIGSAPIAGDGSASLVLNLAVGLHSIVAVWAGDAGFAPSQSDPQTVTVDKAVDADSFKVAPSPFYPVRDGYKDLLKISGITREPASVIIRIKSVATGKLVRRVELGTKSGAYLWAWNGRKADGTMVAAGKYKVLQTLIGAGNHILNAPAAFAVLSLKKIYWTTVTKTLYGDQYVIKGAWGTGWVRQGASSYGRGVRISSGNAYAAVGYAFGSPSATLYKNVAFKVLGRSPNGRHGEIAIWAPALGTYMDLSHYDAWARIGPGYAWWSTKAPLKSHRASGKIRTTVYVGNYGSVNIFDIAKVRVTYTYGVLK